MDEAKEEREQVINPISTIATEVLVDPGTYIPIPLMKGAIKLAQFGKNAGVGGAASGGLYTLKEGGDENYKVTDSLIAAGFGGALNGLIATALGKTVPKITKGRSKEKAIKENNPVISDDAIVNKMMGKPTHIIRDSKSSYNMISNAEHKNNPTVFIDDNNKVKKWVKSAYNLRDEQLLKKMEEANSGSVVKQTATSAPISLDKPIITKPATKSQSLNNLINKALGKFEDSPINQHSKVTDSKVNYELVGEPKDVTNNRLEIPIEEQTRLSANIDNDNPTYAYLKILQEKHPEMFKSEKDVFKFINDVKNNPTHFTQGNKPNNKLMINQKDGKTNIVGINTKADTHNLVVNANKKSRPKELRLLIDKQLEGSTIDSSNPSFKLGHSGSAETSPNMDYKSGSTASDNNIITNSNTKSQGSTIFSSPTVSGALVGAGGGAVTDPDNDGKLSINDLLIGAGAGALAYKGGSKLLTKMKDIEAIAKAKNNLKKITDTDFADVFVGHKIYQKKDYMSLREDMISSKNAKMEDYAQLHEQLKLISDDSRKALHKYISGERNVNLSPSLKEFGDNYVSQIEKQGKELVDLGILDEAQYDKFRGKYLHRVYEKDITKEFSNYFTKGKTIPGVHTRGREWTGTKAEYEKYLEQDKIGDFFGGKIEARKVNNSQYKFTQDWTAEQRHKWGEIEDIAYTLPETLMRMSEMAEHGKMLSKFARQNNHVSDKAIDGYTQLQGERYGALSGKYVSKDIADDINEFNMAMFGAEDGAIFSKEVKDAFRTLSTFWKKSHTVYNPTAHLNNLLSNVTMQYMQGVNPVKAIINAKRGAQAHSKLGQFRELTAKTLVGLTKDEANKLKALTLDEDLQLYMQADKAGLFGRSKLNDILNQYVSPIKNKSKVPNGLKKIDDVASNLYQGEDNIMRFSLLKSLVDKGKSFDEAIKEVNSTIPDYTKPMSRMARFGRNSMLTPFISWTYYSTPIILRQLKERPGRAVALLGALYGINQMFGIDPYDNKDIPQKNFSMKRIPIYKDGKEITTIKVDRWFPHNEILSPHDFVGNLINGGAWKGLYETWNNKNLYYGGKITYNTGARKAYDISKYAIQQISPDAIDKIWNLTESAIVNKKTRKKNPVIQPRSIVQELLNIAGLNTLTYDKEAQRKKAINERLK